MIRLSDSRKGGKAPRPSPSDPGFLTGRFRAYLEAVQGHRFREAIEPRRDLADAGLHLYYWPRKGGRS
jgi:hypothetical protein